MKYPIYKVVLFLILFVNVPFILLAKGTFINQPKKQSKNIQQDEVDKYQYTMGFRLNVGFNSNCSFLFGGIESFADNKVSLKIEEQFWGEKVNGNNIFLEYEVPRTDFRSRNQARSPWDYVEVEIGKKMFVTYCSNSSGQRRNWVIISDSKLFTTIKELITYHNQLEKNPNIILKVQDILAKQDNLIFSGYITTYLRGNAFRDGENVALAFSNLIREKKVSDATLAFAHIALRQILMREGENSLPSATRNAVISKLVNIAISNSKAAEQVFSLMIELSARNKIEIKPFLTKEKRQKLLQNYQTVAAKFVTKPGRKEFEKQLIGDDR